MSLAQDGTTTTTTTTTDTSNNKHNQIHHDSGSIDNEGGDGGSESPEKDTSQVSPEAAGLARGTAKTTTTTSAKAAAIQVAKVSERLSASANAYEAVSQTAAKASSSTKTSATNNTMVGFKRFLIGRLPKPASTAKAVKRGGKIKGVKKLGFPKQPRRIRLQRVAKASDRLSTGFDVYDAFDSTSTTTNKSSRSNNEHHKGIQERKPVFAINTTAMKKKMGQLFNVSGVLIKNTLLGAAAFGSYEQIITTTYNTNTTTNSKTNITIKDTSKDSKINHDDNPKSAIEEEDASKRICLLKDDVYAHASIGRHFGAGMAAGTIHGVVAIALESTSYFFHNINNSKNNNNNQIRNRSKALSNYYTKLKESIRLPPLSWSCKFILHHAIAHSVLFSSYEMSKRFLHSCMNHQKGYNHNEIHEQPQQQQDKEEDKTNPSSIFTTTSTLDVAIIALVGGFAGQLQHFISHYSEQILSVSDDGLHTMLLKQSKRNNNTNIKRRTLFHGGVIDYRYLQKLKGPTIGSLMVAFIPSAVGFVAFEFGKEMASS